MRGIWTAKLLANPTDSYVQEVLQKLNHLEAEAITRIHMPPYAGLV